MQAVAKAAVAGFITANAEAGLQAGHNCVDVAMREVAATISRAQSSCNAVVEDNVNNVVIAEADQEVSSTSAHLLLSALAFVATMHRAVTYSAMSHKATLT